MVSSSTYLFIIWTDVIKYIEFNIQFICLFNFFEDKIAWEKFTHDRSNIVIFPNVDEEQAYFDLSRAFAVLNRSTHAQKAWNSNSKLALLNELIGNDRI